jgi:aminoglycoside phosphotransferase (APT) family kinase protein
MLMRTSSWEMSTIGHPLSDLINLLTPYYLVNEEVNNLPAFAPGALPGLPSQKALVKWYAEVAGWDPTPDLTWGVAFGFFRTTCIFQGIAARWAVRQASSAKAKDHAQQRHPMGRLAWKHVQRARDQAKSKARL